MPSETSTPCRFSLRELRMDLKTAGRILQVGAPMAIQQSIVSCGFLFLQRLVNYYGESMIASYTVASRMENILMIPIIGIQNTMATFAGQNMGAQRPDRVSKGLGQGVLVSLGMTLILCLAQIAGIPLIIRAFQLDAGAAAICRLHLFSSAVAIPIFAVYFPANGAYGRSARKSGAAYRILLMRSMIFPSTCRGRNARSRR